MTFEGFPAPTKNFFSLPNEMINIIAHITNMSELKVIIYILRHTWGFHEYGISKAISTDEFMHGRKYAGDKLDENGEPKRMDEGTGLSNRSVIDGLRAAEEHGYLLCEIDTSDKARTVKSYALKMARPYEGSSQVQTCEEPSHPPYEESSQAPMKKVHRASKDASHQREDTSHRSEKDTTRNTPKKESEREIPVAPTFPLPEPDLPLTPLVTPDTSRAQDTADEPEVPEEEEDEGPPPEPKLHVIHKTVVEKGETLLPPLSVIPPLHTQLPPRCPWNEQRVLAVFDELRGGELPDPLDVAKARTCVPFFVEKSSENKVRRYMAYMGEIDSYWSHRGFDIWNLWKNYPEIERKCLAWEKSKSNGNGHAPPLPGPTEGSRKMAALRAQYAGNAGGGY